MNFNKCGSPYARRKLSGRHRMCGSSMASLAVRCFTIGTSHCWYGSPPGISTPIFDIWRDDLIAVGSPGLSSAATAALGVAGLLGLDNSPVGRLASPAIQIPEKSGLPSARRGVGADMFTLPVSYTHLRAHETG